MTNQLQPVSKGALPLSSDINQLVKALQGLLSPGTIQLAAPLSTPSSAPTAATNGTGSLTGTYGYVYTNIDGVPIDNGTVYINGETTGSTVSASVTASSNAILVSNLAFGGAPGQGGRIYRNAASGSASTGPFYRVTTITDPSQTTYSDDTPDANLGAQLPTSNTTGTPLSAYQATLTDLVIDGGNVTLDPLSGDSQWSPPLFLRATGSSGNSLATYLQLDDTGLLHIRNQSNTDLALLDGSGNLTITVNFTATGFLQSGTTTSGTYAQYNDAGQVSLNGGTFYALMQAVSGGYKIQSGTYPATSSATSYQIPFPDNFTTTPVVFAFYVSSAVNLSTTLTGYSVGVSYFDAYLSTGNTGGNIQWLAIGT